MYKHIAIEGNIGSGKTTLAAMLAEEFSANCILESFEENPFLVKYYNDFEKYALHVELFFLNTRLKQLKAFFSETNTIETFFFSDFFFDKTKIFAQTHLRDESLQLFNSIFSELDQRYFLPDLVLYLHRPVSELKNNIEKRGRAMETDISDVYLKNLELNYRFAFENEKRFPVIWLNCGNKYAQLENAQFNFLKNIVEKKWEKGFHEMSLL